MQLFMLSTQLIESFFCQTHFSHILFPSTFKHEMSVIHTISIKNEHLNSVKKSVIKRNKKIEFLMGFLFLMIFIQNFSFHLLKIIGKKQLVYHLSQLAISLATTPFFYFRCYILCKIFFSATINNEQLVNKLKQIKIINSHKTEIVKHIEDSDKIIFINSFKIDSIINTENVITSSLLILFFTKAFFNFHYQNKNHLITNIATGVCLWARRGTISHLIGEPERLSQVEYVFENDLKPNTEISQSNDSTSSIQTSF